MRIRMTRLIPASILAFFISFATAGELPWMGVSLDPAKGEKDAAKVLPDGVGFEVTSVSIGGPVSRAGGKRGDLWWKIDGQILVNKAQMVVLLKARKPGDRLSVDYYRDGKLKNLSLTLGTRSRPRLVPVSYREEKEDESRVLAKREKVARVEVDGRDLSLSREGGRWRFQVKEKGTVVLSALLKDEEMKDRIPEKWHNSFVILRMTLSDAGESGVARRVRYIPREKEIEE